MNFSETVIFRAPPGTGAALAKAADLEQTKPSELMRRAALDRIKAAAAVEKVTVGEFIQRALGDGLGLRGIRGRHAVLEQAARFGLGIKDHGAGVAVNQRQ